MDSLGKKWIAAADWTGIWVSTNNGSIWQNTYSTSSNVDGVACSSSGTYVYAALSGTAVLGSTNGGYVWKTLLSISNTVYDVACSTSGQFVVAATAVGYYTSTNYGSSWVQTYTSSSGGFYHVTMTSDGAYQFGNLYASSGTAGVLSRTNASWTNTFSVNNAYTIATSSNGQIVLTSASTSVYISSNYGVAGSWTSLTTLGSVPLQSVACSASGGLVLVGGNRGSVYIGYAATASPTLIPTMQPTTFEDSIVFHFTGDVQQYTVISSMVNITACGAQGGGFYSSSNTLENAGGYGGCITTIVPATIGSTLYVYVGGAGGDGSNTVNPDIVSGGYNGGGFGRYGGGGGGCSDVRTNEFDLTSRIVVGAGGGGSGPYSAVGGSGGGSVGGNGVATSGNPATGGTQTAGGSGGYCSPSVGGCPGIDQGGSGSYGYGGTGGTGGGDDGGGGCGFYGGGGGAGNSAGGGGSSYSIGSILSDVSGIRLNDGMVIISIFYPPTSLPSSQPTCEPTTTPSVTPTVAPSKIPTSLPTLEPSFAPTQSPTETPSAFPSDVPTVSPTNSPSCFPTLDPTVAPTVEPTGSPTNTLLYTPTLSPTPSPTVDPTMTPTYSTTSIPTIMETEIPTVFPTIATTEIPTASPSNSSSLEPTLQPSLTSSPSLSTTFLPTHDPTLFETGNPSQTPSQNPSFLPTMLTTTVSPTIVATPSDVVMIEFSVQQNFVGISYATYTAYWAMNNMVIEQTTASLLSCNHMTSWLPVLFLQYQYNLQTSWNISLEDWQKRVAPYFDPDKRHLPTWVL